MNETFTEAFIEIIYAEDKAPFNELSQTTIDACRKYSAVEMRIILGQEQYQATSEQIEIGLTDSHPIVRAVYAERNDFVPTTAQIQRGLEDVDVHVREIWIQKAKELSASLLDDSVIDDVQYSI